jgi:thioredoxin reductase
VRTTDIAVIGAGIAGLSAAFTACRHGAHVTLIDENYAPGGWQRWSLRRLSDLDASLGEMRGHEFAAWAADELRGSPVLYEPGAEAWGLFDDRVVCVTTADASYQVRADRVIIATGSFDIVTPFPGWALPGVMTARAALRLMHLDWVVPGRRVAVVGAGDQASEVIEALELTGATTVAVGTDPGSLVAGGDERVEWIERGGVRENIDCIVIAQSVQPDPELALQAQVSAAFSTHDGCFVPQRSERLETSVRGLYVVGDAGGSCAAAQAWAEGRLAALAAIDHRDTADALETLARLASSAAV